MPKKQDQVKVMKLALEALETSKPIMDHYVEARERHELAKKELSAMIEQMEKEA